MIKKIVNVIGLGYIGLPTAALLASYGYMVFGTDTNQRIVDSINQGETHINEPDLSTYVRSAVKAGRLKASKVNQEADIYMICVPTILHERGGIPQPNINDVLESARSIAPFVKAGDLVILESTSPIGTTEKLRDLLSEVGVKVEEIHFAYCPERVFPGKIMTELVENDRIVGGVSPAATKAAADFYRTFVRGEVFETEVKIAEMCKLVENSFRDVNIAFANELSKICDKEGINVWKLIQLANHHPRVNILEPGVGVGGHCIAMDPWYLVARDIENTKLIRISREVNNQKTEWVIDKIKKAASSIRSKNGEKPVIACLGLSFKPNTSDLRESPALHVALTLKSQGYDVIAVEPNIEFVDEISIEKLDKAIEDADLIVLLLKHSQFMNQSIKSRLSKKSTIDFCGIMID